MDLRRVLSTIQSAQADVICLQEVDRWVWRSAFRDQARWLAARLGMQHRFAGADRVGIIGSGGSAILAEGGFGPTSVLRLPAAEDGPPRCAMSTLALGRNQQCSVVTIHLAVRHRDAGRQLEAVLQASEDLPLPVVLTGDLNMAPAAIQPALAAAGFALGVAPPTFPADVPRVQIDHIAVRGGVVTSTEVLPTAGSDHRCLVVDLDVG